MNVKKMPRGDLKFQERVLLTVEAQWPLSGRRNISSRGETAPDIYSRRERLLTLFLLVNSKWRNWSGPFALNQRHRRAPHSFAADQRRSIR